MAAEENPGQGKEKGKGAGRRRIPKPPLQHDMPAEEGAARTPQPEAPAPGGKGRRKISSRKEEGKPVRVSDIMTEDPVCCLPDTPLERVARLMAENSCGAIPVIRAPEDRVPVGIITDRDVAVRTVAHGRNPLEMRAGDIMSGEPVTVGPEDPVERCAELMRGHRLRRIIVVDFSGRVRGLVVQAQIARALPKDDLGGIVRDISTPPTEG